MPMVRKSPSMSQDQINGYNEQITKIREKNQCDQCHAHRTLTLLKSSNTAYATGQRRACRELLEVPHSCNADLMEEFLAGQIVRAIKGVKVGG